MLRVLTLPFLRKDSRSRMAGGELRLGTRAMYMRFIYDNNILMSSKVTNIHAYIITIKALPISITSNT
jgi:hypothetical protein